MNTLMLTTFAWKCVGIFDIKVAYQQNYIYVSFYSLINQDNTQKTMVSTICKGLLYKTPLFPILFGAIQTL